MLPLHSSGGIAITSSPHSCEKENPMWRLATLALLLCAGCKDDLYTKPTHDWFGPYTSTAPSTAPGHENDAPAPQPQPQHQP
jgi:hypothetical protein